MVVELGGVRFRDGLLLQPEVCGHAGTHGAPSGFSDLVLTEDAAETFRAAGSQPGPALR